MFALQINGENEIPLYTFLKSKCPTVKKKFFEYVMYEPLKSDDVRWNFEKFLLNEQGRPVRRYDESLDPMEIVPDIDAMLERIEKNNL